MQDFQSLGLPEALLDSLGFMNYSVPTPIQAQTIPAALEGKDVLGTAQTGTGKTAAYGIPLVAYLLNTTGTSALVLTPTRELATQVHAMLVQMLGRKSGINTALIIGGEPMPKQLQQLHSKPRLVVGTPGRLNDHLDRKTLKLDSTSFLVLDETDRMLDMGFGIQLEQIAEFLPAKRQTLMFSATLPKNILSLVQQYTKDAVRVSIGSTIAAADTIKQEIIRISEAEKHDALLAQLELRTGTFVVFVARKTQAEKLANKLRDQGHSADAIHGDLRQRNREKVIRAFRNRKYRILVATDVAARGLDIPHIECVVNFDLPQCEEDFIHRIGRTGRAGAEGSAVSLITPQDHSKWRAICKMMDPSAKIDSSFADPANSGGKRGLNRSSNRSPARSYNDRGPSRFAKTEALIYQEQPKRERSYGAPRGDSKFTRPEGQSFRPRGDDAPRGESRFARPEGQSFRPRSDCAPRGDSKFARPEGQSFRPRSDSAPRGDSRFARPEGQSFRPRSDCAPRGDSKFARPEGQSFRPRSDSAPRGDSRFARPEGQSFRPRSDSAPRGDSRFARPEGQSFRPRGDDAPRSDSRFTRPEGQSFRPRSDSAPRGDSRFARPEGQSFRPRSDSAPRGDSRFAKPEGRSFRTDDSSGARKPSSGFKRPGDNTRPDSDFKKQRKFS
jgi:superfamily II DNA/RNA helicase